MLIKICGITNIDDALLAIQAGATHIGLIFVEKSPRYVQPEAAAEIVAAVQKKAIVVGVFQNHTRERVAKIAAKTGIDMIQLHGQEDADYWHDVALATGKDLIKTAVIESGGIDLLPRGTARLVGGNSPVKYLLFDRAKGTTDDAQTWLNDAVQEIIEAEKTNALPPYFFAGGLTAQNVGSVLEKISPQGVDVASGVELSPGKKDPELVKKFIAEAARCARQTLTGAEEKR